MIENRGEGGAESRVANLSSFTFQKSPKYPRRMTSKRNDTTSLSEEVFIIFYHTFIQVSKYTRLMWESMKIKLTMALPKMLDVLRLYTFLNYFM